MGPRVGFYASAHCDAKKVLKANGDRIMVDLDKLADKVTDAWCDVLKEFLTNEGIFNDGCGLLVGLDMPDRITMKNKLRDYFDKLNTARLSEVIRKTK